MELSKSMFLNSILIPIIHSRDNTKKFFYRSTNKNSKKYFITINNIFCTNLLSNKKSIRKTTAIDLL